MSMQIEVIYENGILKPSRALPLQEGQKITITLHGVGSAAQRFCGSLRWTRDADELHRYLDDPDESSWSCRDV
ncbi:MAG: antitoxin family protein [Gemmataceae bacterium]